MLSPGEITGKTCISYSSAGLEWKGWSGELLAWSPAPSSCSLASTRAWNHATCRSLMVAKSSIDAVLRKDGCMKAISCWGQFCCSCTFTVRLRKFLYFFCIFATLQSSSQVQGSNRDLWRARVMVGKGKDLWHVHLKNIYEQSAAMRPGIRTQWEINQTQQISLLPKPHHFWCLEDISSCWLACLCNSLRVATGLTWGPEMEVVTNWVTTRFYL